MTPVQYIIIIYLYLFYLSQIKTIMELGSGLNGHSNIAHGGFVSTILDETMGVVNVKLNGRHTFTAYLNVTFKKPTPTPGIVMCRAWISKVGMIYIHIIKTDRKKKMKTISNNTSSSFFLLLFFFFLLSSDGRKRFTCASLEDGSGTVFATAEALFLSFKAAL